MTKIFSNDFYNNSLFANGIKPIIEEESINLVSSNHSNSSLIKRIKSYLFFQPNPDMIAVNQKLTQIFTELKDSNSEMSQILIQDLHLRDKKSYKHILGNLFLINIKFERQNKKFSLPRLACSITNIFRSFFNYPPVTYYQHSVISIDQWKEVLKPIQKQAFHLTPEEASQTKFFIQTNEEAAKALNSDNLDKLQYGFIESIPFKHGYNHYRLFYNKEEKVFKLTLAFTRGEPCLSSTAHFNQGPLRYSVEVTGKGENGEGKGTLWNEYEFKKSFFQQGGSYRSSGPLIIDENMEITLSCEGEIPFKFTIKQKGKE